ncbi:flagellar motor protein [Vulgatibacter incomptus]|uniref:Flagellar motor rotation protein MotA n=1 Tax=Vulgatibacter incomptus TaxID=1391653 RepID=A0A0K1PIT4_9BACT|nr:flagellar motor protein [Vulgatibacter incomptus]AKU93019.1 Flagellar motor rotation protein MotA [Vulgatibacter incomptus]
MDITSILGLVVAIGFILLGQILEGGHPSSIMQLTAAIIVFGGTLGAVMVAFPTRDFMRGVKMLRMAFVETRSDLAALVAQIGELAAVARREGVLALESRVASLEDPFLRKAVQYVVDGVDPSVARESLEAEIDSVYAEQVIGAKVYESAGGFAPTVGILGAVLGLIHVMENLSDPSKLGGGIAVAFVATVYGVGAANILFLPIANKLKRKVSLEKERKLLITEGILGIQEGLNPRVLEEKLRSYAGGLGAEAKQAA